MSDSSSTPWQPNYPTCDNQDQSAITIKLWEYFSSAAAGVCQLYKSKLDQCADFQCLMDALSPMDQFFRGSQLSIGAATRNGRLMGSRCVRLQLRDLSFASSQPQETVNGIEVVVPLSVLFAHELGRNNSPSICVLGKRRLSSHKHSSRRCRHKRKRILYRCSPGLPSISELSSSHDSLVVGSMIPDSTCTAVTPRSNESGALDTHVTWQDSVNEKSPCQVDSANVNLTARKRRACDFVTQCSPPLRDCLISCETDRRHASVNRDSFGVFQDALHMSNLLDPFSKFSVTAEHDDGPDVAPKRPRNVCLNTTDKHPASVLP